MTLTVTAKKSLREEVATILGMKAPKIVAASPSKPNITYMVKSFSSIKEAFDKSVYSVVKQRVKFPKNDSVLPAFEYLYKYLREALGRHFTEPMGAPDLPQLRLVDMYHSSVDIAYLCIFPREKLRSSKNPQREISSPRLKDPLVIPL